MNLPQYEVTSDDKLYKFTFISEGKNGTVEKDVELQNIYQKHLKHSPSMECCLMKSLRDSVGNALVSEL